MKKYTILIALTFMAMAAHAQTRVTTVHRGGDTPMQMPVHLLDSIKTDGTNLIFHYGASTWSTPLEGLDSLSFAEVDGMPSISLAPTEIDTTGMISIIWNGSDVTISNPYPGDSIKVTAEGGHVTVKSNATDCGTVVYNLSGNSSDGWLHFTKLSTPIVLRIDGLDLVSSGAAALLIDKNQNALVELVGRSANHLADADSNADKAVLYGKGSITFQGTGYLDVTSSFVNGIQGKRGVIFNGGSTSVTVTANTAKGIKTDNDFVMYGGILSVTASGSIAIDTSDTYETGYDFSYCTGIKAGDADDGAEGSVYVNGGVLTVDCPATNAGGRCLSSDYDIIFNGGEVILTTAGNGLAVGGTGRNAQEGYACACVSADRDVIVNGGSLDMRSTGIGGRGIKVDGRFIMGRSGAGDDLANLYIQTSGAPANAVSGGGPGGPGGSEVDYWKGLPKGIKAEGNLYINSGHLGVYCSQTSGDPNGEAIESKDSLFINGGTVEANAYDDAINAANYLEINGGSIWCYSRGNDAIDCNGNTLIRGGLIVAKGQEVGIDAATDAGGHFIFDGGIIVCQGGQMGAWDNPNVSGYQKYLQINNNGSNGLTVVNADGDTLLMFRQSLPSGSAGFESMLTDPGAKPPPGGGGNTTIFSCPEITTGTYRYWTSSTFTGGTSWHGVHTGSSATVSGNPQSVTPR